MSLPNQLFRLRSLLRLSISTLLHPNHHQVQYEKLQIRGEGPDGATATLTILDCDTITQVMSCSRQKNCLKTNNLIKSSSFKCI